jgi:hypothetical protein
VKSTNDGTLRESPAAGAPQSEGLLSRDELALTAVCGQTGKPFLMVVRRQGRTVLELIRAVAIGPAPSAGRVPVPVQLATPACVPRNFCSGCGHKLEPAWTFCRRCGKKVLPQPDAHAAQGGGADGRTSENPAAPFQALNMSAKIHIGSSYDGCPYCRATGYFRCGRCRMFSCWDSYNKRPHLDHADVWCEACRSWRCTSKKGEDDNSLSELTAYAAGGNTVDLRNSPAPGSARQDRIIGRPTSIRAYLK